MSYPTVEALRPKRFQRRNGHHPLAVIPPVVVTQLPHRA